MMQGMQGMHGMCPMCGGGWVGMLLFGIIILAVLVGLGWLLYRLGSRGGSRGG